MSLDADAVDTLVDTAKTTADGTEVADAADAPGKSTPKLRNIDDYRRLNTRATQEGMYAGIVGGGVMTWLAKRIGMNKNAMVVTFLVGSTGISFLYSRAIITRTLGEHYAERRAALLPKTPDGAPLVSDPADPMPDLRPKVPELEERKRWYPRGSGLEGEVAGEVDMGDKFVRPGVPRV